MQLRKNKHKELIFDGNKQFEINTETKENENEIENENNIELLESKNNEDLELQFEINKFISNENTNIILVCNKCDLDYKTEWKVTFEDGIKLAKKWKCPLIQVSGKNNENAKLILEVIVKNRYCLRNLPFNIRHMFKRIYEY